MDNDHVRLYNLSCSSLPVLLKQLRCRRNRAPASAWRRALLLALERMGQRQEALARVTAVEILTILSVRAADRRHPQSATARSMVERFGAATRRRYHRGSLTPAQGHHPEVLTLWLRRAAKALTPLTRDTTERLWRRWHPGPPLPEPLWERLVQIKTTKARARAFVTRAADYWDEDSLKKALQRERRRQRGQQTR